MAVFAVLQLPSVAMAVDCAFQDVNDDGIFNAGDILVPDTAWVGGTPFVSVHPFVVPVGCNKVLALAPNPSKGVKVTATKITFLGRLEYLQAGGRGVVLIADPTQVPGAVSGNGDLIVGNGTTLAVIKAGGYNDIPINTPALPVKAVALWGTGTCSFNLAEIRGVSPIQDTRIGILCTNDLTFENTIVEGSRTNIQSLSGSITAIGGVVPGGFSLAKMCDDPATNLTGNGNNNNLIDAGDYPCTLNLGAFVNVQFASIAEMQAACLIDPIPGANKFHAFNDPLIMIAGAGAGNNIDIRGASVVGRYRVALVAEDGDLLTQGAIIDHGQQVGLSVPGGARIWLFANPTSVVRLPVDREDFLGPSTGTTFVADACYQSPNPVRVGQDAGGLIHVDGVTAPPPCKQNNATDFVPVLNGIF
jgi:hypothetical protein